jgi:hypothetical protein
MRAQAAGKRMNGLISAAIVLALVGGPWLAAAPALPCTTLDPGNPGNFTREGQQPAIPGAVLRLIDTSSSDRIVFFANDACAGLGRDCDVVATFRMIQAIPNNVDAGNRVVINDGISRAAIATCVVISGVRGIGLLSQGQPSDASSYPVFVPVDWETVPITIRLRRYANGDAELIEINGAAPNPRALLLAGQVAGKTRAGGTVEFGVGSPPEPECTVEYAAFRSEPTATSVEEGSAPGDEPFLRVVPNPSRDEVTIRFSLPTVGATRLGVYDTAGRRVRDLRLTSAYSSVTWDGTDENGRSVGTGTYVLRLQDGRRSVASKVTLVR